MLLLEAVTFENPLMSMEPGSKIVAFYGFVKIHPKKTMKKVKKVLKAPKMKISENEKRKLFLP